MTSIKWILFLVQTSMHLSIDEIIPISISLWMIVTNKALAIVLDVVDLLNAANTETNVCEQRAMTEPSLADALCC